LDDGISSIQSPRKSLVIDLATRRANAMLPTPYWRVSAPPPDPEVAPEPCMPPLPVEPVVLLCLPFESRVSEPPSPFETPAGFTAPDCAEGAVFSFCCARSWDLCSEAGPCADGAVVDGDVAAVTGDIAMMPIDSTTVRSAALDNELVRYRLMVFPRLGAERRNLGASE